MTIGMRTALIVALAGTALVLMAALLAPLTGVEPARYLWLALPVPPLLGLVTWLVLRRDLSRQADMVVEALSRAGAGDHALRLAEGDDESGRVARAFNAMQLHIEADQSRTHAALEYQAMHDAVTGLPNRTLLMDRLGQAIRAAQRGGHRLALLLADLDHFKEINDTMGHHTGDRVLQQAAQRMRRVVRQSDTVARLGGDEFAFLLPTADADQAMRVAAKVARAFERPFDVEASSFSLGASIGVAVFPEHGADGSTLMRRADVAMYSAKRGHRGCALYSRELDRDSARYLALKNELRAAIAANQLMLAYQPVVELRSGAVTGVEALARWRHPTRGVLYPDDFIPLAERTGLIRDVTLWVIRTVSTHCREWSALGLELRVAVNLSAHNLYDAELPQVVDRLLLEGDHDRPVQLRLEITETALMPGPSRSLDVLNRLSAQGVRISIDDFGTGYSSLAYLKRLPIDELKIDKSFVTAMVHDSDDAAIVRSTIDLAHNLGLRVVAEGVEDEATYELLAGMHCDAVQGYYISRPVEAPALIEWLSRERAIGAT